MKTMFRTNVDCCKQFMHSLNAELGDTQPMTDDRVVVSTNNAKIVELQVVGRRWWPDELEIELNLTKYWNERGYTDFEKFVQGPPLNS